MINHGDLRMMISLVLADMDTVLPGAWSPQAVDLLIGTATTESTIGGETYFYQTVGPARGIFQIEPDTAKDCHVNYIAYRGELADWFADVGEHDLVYNLRYQIAIARLVYWRRNFEWPGAVVDLVPHSPYIRRLGEIWKEHYNTVLGAGTVEKFVEAFPS